MSSSSEEDQSSVARHRPQASDQDQPQHDPDPRYYREVALSDIPSQYAEEVDTFRRILSLPGPRESMPRSSTLNMIFRLLIYLRVNISNLLPLQRGTRWDSPVIRRNFRS